jgi:magnesium transporter
MALTHLTVESPAGGWQEAVPVDAVSELLERGDALLWLDIVDPGPRELALLREEFGFHELALEDAAKRHQRPKCDEYGDYYYIVLYGARARDGTLDTQELQLFWGKNYLVTLHAAPLPLIDEARRRWQRGVNRVGDGVAYLVYTLLDSVVDEYMQVQDYLAEQVEDLEERIYPCPQPAVVAELFALRKAVVRLRRVLGPTRDVLNEIIRRDLPLFPEPMRPYFVDVYDHVLRVLDGVDTYRELLAAALDMYLSAVSNQLNQTVKRMTALTLIVMVPTLIAGIYGMNYTASFIPPEDTPHAFLWICLVMLGVAGGITWVFKRLDWL